MPRSMMPRLMKPVRPIKPLRLRSTRLMRQMRPTKLMTPKLTRLMRPIRLLRSTMRPTRLMMLALAMSVWTARPM